MPPSGGTRTDLTPITATQGVAWTATFTPANGVFSPGAPLNPVVPQRPRVIDFPSGVNTIITPRSYEAFGFPQLRAFANVELVRLAIETRKDQVERLTWQISPSDKNRRPHDAEARIRKVSKFFAKPDGVTPFSTWLRMSIEDLLVLDAPAFEKRRSRDGTLIALDVIPGDTIKPMVDDTGRRPLAPLPAYQQVIKGRPWVNLSTEDLIYAPRNPRPGKVYGLSPVEQIIVTITTAMQRQAAQLAYFSESNLPAGLATTPEGWTPENLKLWQEWMDDRLSGNTAQRSKLLWAPFGSEYQPFKAAPLKDEFDEWLARVVAFAFSLPPTPFVRQMNKGTAGEDDERSMEEGLYPLKLWAKRIFDDVIQNDLGHPDLEFVWNVQQEVDPDTQSKIDDRDLRNGTLLLNEVRQRRGQDPVKGGNEPLIYTAAGAVPLDRVLNPPEPTLPANTDPAPGAIADEET